jgi:hypothetical protein
MVKTNYRGNHMSYTKVYPEYYDLSQTIIQDGTSFPGNRAHYTFTNQFTGDYNPFWRSQVKAGSNATSPASGVRESFESDFMDFFQVLQSTTQSWVTSSTQLIGDGIPYGYPNAAFQSAPASTVTDVTNRAIRKFLDSCDTARSSIELGQDIGEIRETIRGIIHPLQTLREFTLTHLSNVLKRTKKLKAKHSLAKVAADSFLEYKFGWAPLAADIGQAYAGLTNNKGHVDVQSVNGSAYDTWPISQTAGISSVSAGNFIAQTDLIVTGSFSVRYKGGIRTSQANGRIGFMQMMQLDLPHFVPTIWDLLPYSWIADYFVNVGDILRALSFQTNNLAWGNLTIRTTNEYRYSTSMIDNYYSGPGGWRSIVRTASGGNPSVSRVNFQRTGISPDSLVPSVQFSLPLGSLKPWENMLALMVGRQKDISRVARNLINSSRIETN